MRRGRRGTHHGCCRGDCVKGERAEVCAVVRRISGCSVRAVEVVEWRVEVEVLSGWRRLAGEMMGGLAG
jgi:hypothetical protein